MRRARCFVTAVLAVGLIGPVATAQAEPRSVSPATTQTITLISGDKVVVDERGALVRVDGRPGMSFARYVRNDHQYVVPADAVEALTQDRVDQRFFDVTALHSYGYTDDKIDRIPLLDNSFRATAAVPKKEAAQRWTRRAGLRSAGKLWLDGKARITLDQSVPMVNAPAAWQAGFDGAGVTVAVLDTGYDQNHPELEDVVATAKDFTAAGIQDNVGHGTHVAATIAGRGAKYSGVAKGAKLAVGRVCEAEWCLDSAIIAGMEWAVREARAKVVNMSLGGDQTDGTDPLSRKVNELTAETGALFVVAAGNAGTFRKVSAPASADAALAVANLTKSGEINESSQRGPRLRDFAVKPDIAAPGTDIVAARAAGTYPEHAVGDLHARLTGTSMATPHVAGAAAVLAQRNPSWTATELKSHLMATVKPTEDTPTNVGTGLLDVGRAAAQTVRADVGSLSFGLVEWPHTRTFTKTITYRNDGDQPVSLALRHNLGADFTVPESVVVPARGTAPVDVVLDPRKGLGTFFGHVRASADGVSLTTAVGAYVQEERHQLTMKVTGRDGRPAADGFAVLVNQTTKEGSLLELGDDGVGSVKLPVADYAIVTRIGETTANDAWFTPVSVTDLSGGVSLTKDVSVELNLRDAKPIAVDVHDDRVTPILREMYLKVPQNPSKSNGVSSRVDGRVPVYGLTFGAALPELTYDTAVKAAQPRIAVVGGFPVNYYESSPFLTPGDHAYDVAERGGDVRGKMALVRQAGEDPYAVAAAMKDAGALAVLWAGPVPFGYEELTALPVIAVGEHFVASTPSRLTFRAVGGSPVSYTLYLPEKGAVPAGKTYHVKRSELAEVKARYYTSGADGMVRTRNYPLVNGVPAHNLIAIDELLAAPAERVEYFSAGNGISWYHEGFVGRFSGAGDDPQVTSWADLKPVAFAPGRRYERANMRAVSAPRLGRPDVVPWSQGGGVSRSGDLINARISPFGGSTWVENWVLSGAGSMELRRGEESLGYSNFRQGSFHAPARDGRYTLRLDGFRDTAALSTNVHTTWEFSGANEGALPLLQVDYVLPVDLRNSWKASVPMPVKFTASRQAGAGKATVRDIKAYASFDDGLNWVPVKSIVPPGGKPGGYVSLRVVAVDTDGNTVDQTVLKAYRLRP